MDWVWLDIIQANGVSVENVNLLRIKFVLSLGIEDLVSCSLTSVLVVVARSRLPAWGEDRVVEALTDCVYTKDARRGLNHP